MNKLPLTRQDKVFEQPRTRDFHLIPQSESQAEEPLGFSQNRLLEKKLFLDRDDSYEKRMERIRKKVTDLFRPPSLSQKTTEAGPSEPYPYVRETFDDHVVVEVGPKTYAVPYSLTESGEKIGKPKRIRPAYVEMEAGDEDFEESDSDTLRESDTQLMEKWSNVARAAAAQARRARKKARASGKDPRKAGSRAALNAFGRFFGKAESGQIKPKVFPRHHGSTRYKVRHYSKAYGIESF